MLPRIHGGADDDFAEIVTHYSGLNWKAARRFRDAHAEALDRVAADATSHALHPEMAGPEERYVPVRGFPYVVIFRTADPAETVVLAVLHTASGPGAYRRAARRR